MASAAFKETDMAGALSPVSSQTTNSSSLKGLSTLSSKVTSVLSTSYADSEFRDALSLLDSRGIQNTAEARRRLRLDLHREVIDSNGEIIDEFGRVADVGPKFPHNSHGGLLVPLLLSTGCCGQKIITDLTGVATSLHRQHAGKAQ